MLEHLGLPFGYQYSKQTGGNTTGKVTYDEFDSIMDVKMFSHTFNTKAPSSLSIDNVVKHNQKIKGQNKEQKNKK